MAGSVRIEIDRTGLGDALLRSPEVRALIAEKTAAVAAGVSGAPAERVHAGTYGRSRARGYVSAPAWAEVAHGALSRALGAAR